MELIFEAGFKKTKKNSLGLSFVSNHWVLLIRNCGAAVKYARGQGPQIKQQAWSMLTFHFFQSFLTVWTLLISNAQEL